MQNKVTKIKPFYKAIFKKNQHFNNYNSQSSQISFVALADISLSNLRGIGSKGKNWPCPTALSLKSLECIFFKLSKNTFSVDIF